MRAVAAIAMLIAASCASAPPAETPPASPVSSITHVADQPKRELPPGWSGRAGLMVIPESVKTYPGEHAVDGVVMEQAQAWRRTARLGEAFSVEGRDDLTLPAGTPLRATHFIYVRPVYPRGQRPPETHDWNWCADTTPDTSVCFAWIEPGVVLVGAMTGGSPSARDPRNRIRAPEPVIVEQAVDTFPRLIRHITVNSITARGVVYGVATRDGEQLSSYTSPPTAWGEAYTTYIAQDAAYALRATPVDGGDGPPAKVSVTLTPFTPGSGQ